LEDFSPALGHFTGALRTIPLVDSRPEKSRQFYKSKEIIMKPCTIAKTLTLAAVTVLALSIAPRAKADCSDATLAGHHFAYTSTGIIVSAPIPALVGPSAEVGVLYFDEKGDVSFIFHSSQNGNIGPGTATGTYSVNEDCTGKFTETSDGFTAHFNFVIDSNGTQFQAICQDSGVVATRTGRRQFPEDDWGR
jgi:hypothetical protein